MDSIKPKTAEILKLLPEYDALLGKTNIDAQFLDAAGSKLKIISTPSAGFDHLDVAEIKKRGIKVGNASQVLSAAVAEVAVFLLLGATRRAHEGRQQLEKGIVGSGFQWMLGHDLRNKTVGIVGLGNIGVEIVKRLKPFEINKFVYTGHSRKKIGDELNAEFVSFDKLLERSDFVVNCVPLNAKTEKLFGDIAFNKMKKSAVFVNIGRGKTVDTEALVRALNNRTIFAAGLDVTEPEPLPIGHELMKLSNALVIPHMGSATIETRTDMAIAAVQNILNGFESKPLLYEL
ncbi:glyoxylate reductase/hydroxypyruvate reductase-like isoform X2 [Phymastichus coffea]|nr:glyoxylate reductase/hydroxypyruvate reductase-like isoform X2 [Phymastichus coffea]XP_058795760.1 glyoxylate reductase/hydroxypyruvate reductase-like isoform X2 [Phymastichus coffea]XP_058795761.1 glyoxylate reductase/hydroxypyruvate reductase-like isoform X2 [Phymastichus coffea]